MQRQNYTSQSQLIDLWLSWHLFCGFRQSKESLNKHFLLVSSHKNDIYFCKLALKMAKIGILGAPGGPASILKTSNEIKA
jgi:hypothetical protein